MPSKKKRIQLYADECFPVPSVTYLRSLGYSIIHAYDRNFVQKTDRFHLQTSKKMKRVLITLDRDFLYYEQISLKGYPGAVVISAGSSTPPHINKICKKFLKEIGEAFIKEALVKITVDKITKVKEGKTVFEKIYEQKR